MFTQTINHTQYPMQKDLTKKIQTAQAEGKGN